MAAIEREATCTWEGNLARGSGRLTSGSSVAFSGLAFSLPTEETSPEELLAAAHAGCFGMALTSILTNAEVPPGRLDIRCRISVDDIPGEGFRVTGSHLTIGADVDGLAKDALKAAAEAADRACPYSALLRDGGATVTVELARDST